ncbi:MAG: hypothetical protein ACT4P4_23915 [Betaproteobacteria bacterium]
MSTQRGAFDGPTWDQRILERIDPGIDVTLIEENLRRTPLERLQRMQDRMRFMLAARERPPSPS